MNNILQNKTLLMVLGGILLAAVVWYSFLRDRGTTALLETENLTTATKNDADIVGTLLALRAVTLSGTIFSDPAFLQLTDFGSAIVPEPVGRTNPFAPLTGAAAAATPGAGTAIISATTTASSTPQR